MKNYLNNKFNEQKFTSPNISAFFFVVVCRTNYWHFLCVFLSFFRIACSFASSIICNRVPGLTPAQRQLCSEAPDAFIALGDGHMLGAEECQHQFKGNSETNSFAFDAALFLF